MSTVTQSLPCQGLNCNKDASRLECPKCKELGIQNSVFCDQACFKKSWSSHKNVHKAASSKLAALAAALSDPAGPPGTHNPFPTHRFTGALRPVYPLSPRRQIREGVAKPDWADDGVWATAKTWWGVSVAAMRSPRLTLLSSVLVVNGIPREEQKLARGLASIDIHTPEQIETMRRISRVGREVLDLAASHIKPGVTTDEIDKVVHDATVAAGAYPSPLNYHKFPKSVCTSINEVICHGIPDKRPLEEGDIINLDVSLYKDGFHTDLNATYPVGQISADSARLIRTTRASLDAAIALCKPGTPFRDIGGAIEPICTKEGFSVVRTYTGHGVGKQFHQDPTILHFNNARSKGVMKPGMIFTIEPMVNGSPSFHVDHWPDDWTAVTRDGARSAQFEETILITDDGCEVLTAAGDWVEVGHAKKPKAAA